MTHSYEITTNETAHPRDVAVHDIGGFAMYEVAQETQTIPEISTELQATYIDYDPAKTYLLGCGDERPEAEGSRADIEAQLRKQGRLPENNALASEYLRIYGGIIGIAEVIAVAMAAQSDASILDHYKGGFTEFVADVNRRFSAGGNVIPVIHTAQSNEGNKDTFDPSLPGPLGCAKGTKIGLVASLTGNKQRYPDQFELALREDHELIGDTMRTELIVDAFDAVGRKFFGDDHGDYEEGTFSRADAVSSDVPKQTLAGSHAPNDYARVAINFRPDRVSSAKAAMEIGQPLYNVDATIVAESILKTFRELNFDPATLLQTIVHQTRGTRAGLAGGDASRLRVERYGDFQEAVDYLESIKSAA